MSSRYSLSCSVCTDGLKFSAAHASNCSVSEFPSGTGRRCFGLHKGIYILTLFWLNRIGMTLAVSLLDCGSIYFTPFLLLLWHFYLVRVEQRDTFLPSWWELCVHFLAFSLSFFIAFPYVLYSPYRIYMD